MIFDDYEALEAVTNTKFVKEMKRLIDDEEFEILYAKQGLASATVMLKNDIGEFKKCSYAKPSDAFVINTFWYSDILDILDAMGKEWPK